MDEKSFVRSDVNCFGRGEVRRFVVWVMERVVMEVVCDVSVA